MVEICWNPNRLVTFLIFMAPTTGLDTSWINAARGGWPDVRELARDAAMNSSAKSMSPSPGITAVFNWELGKYMLHVVRGCHIMLFYNIIDTYMHTVISVIRAHKCIIHIYIHTYILHIYYTYIYTHIALIRGWNGKFSKRISLRWKRKIIFRLLHPNGSTSTFIDKRFPKVLTMAMIDNVPSGNLT